MPIKREFRRLSTRQNITEIKFTGGNFSRKRINHEIKRIRTRIPSSRFQVLLPYENWKPGSWFEDNDDISLFSLLDHYDDAQMPDGMEDTPSYNKSIVYTLLIILYISILIFAKKILNNHHAYLQ